MNEKVEAFIATIRDSFIGSQQVYTGGSCYHFYLILKQVFPQAQPYYDADHIISEIDGRYYDITGEVNPMDYAECEEVKPEEFAEFEQWGFAKNNLLFKRCPHCEEEILLDTKGNITT